jgi:Ca-activated chloride channel family protein
VAARPLIDEMLHHAFAHPWLLVSLAMLPLLGLLAIWAGWKRRHALAQLGELSALAMQMSVRPRRWRLRGVGLVLGLLCLGVGMAGPQWGRDWEQSVAPGRDLVVVLDCSRSMFAETPSRLERARAALLDLVQVIEQRGGHRLALVLVAGRAKLVCPLTHDYDHFRGLIQDVTSLAQDRDLEPGPGEVSGTRLGQALAVAALADDPRFQTSRDILLLSDGDDPARDGEWRSGARAAAAAGIRVYTIGIGDPHTSSPIRLEGRPLEHDGKEVRTRLEEAPLREIATLTQGIYTAAYTRAVPLGSLYLQTIAGQPVRDDNDDALPVYQQRFTWFLGPAFTFLVGAMLFGEGSRRFRVTR